MQKRQVPSWDEYFMSMAYMAATKSPDRSHQTGCVIVKDRQIVATGFNSFPRGCRDEGTQVRQMWEGLGVSAQVIEDTFAGVEARHERPAKYKWTEHAERNAIYSVARNGGPALLGTTMYIPWFPCADCARAIIQSGIAKVVCYEPDLNDERWGEDFKVTLHMLGEAQIIVSYIPALAQS